MELEEKVARFQEIERRGLLDRLTQRQQAGWAEYKRRHNLPDYQTKEETFDWSKVTPEMREQIAANNRDYDNQSYAGRMVKDAVTGAGEGIVSGLYNAANGATLGGAGWLDRKTGGNFTALDERLQRRADEAGAVAGFLNKAAKFTSEIGGNVAGAGGAITKGLTKTGLKGLGLGLTDAAVQGGIYGTTSADNWADVPANAAFGAAGGVAFGAALGGTAGILGKFAGMFRKGGKNAKDAKAAMDYLRKELGDDAVNAMIKEARENNLSLAEVADQKALDIVQKARQQTPAARHTIADNLEKLENRNIDNSQNFIDDMFGKRSGYETVDDITEAAIEKTRPMYEEMEGMGDLAAYETKDVPQQNFKRWYKDAKLYDENGNPLKLYHQTGADFDVFEKGLESAGKYDYETPSGFFFKSNDADIGLAGKKQIPVYIRGKNGISFKNREEARKYFREKIDGYDDLLTKYNNVDNEYLAKEAQRELLLDKKIDALEKNPKYKTADASTQLKMREDVINSIDDNAFYDEWREAGNKYALQMKDKINKYVADNNIDFMKLENDSGSIGKKTTDAYIVFNPNQIKSVNNSGAWSESPSLSDAGWKPESKIANLVNENDVIADTIKGVKRSLSSLKKAPDTDARVLLEARKVLSAQTKSPDGAVKMQAINALKDLDPVLKTLFGGKLEQANKIRGDAYKYEDAFEFGQKIFGGSMSPERFSKEFNKLTDFEKEAVELGLRDKLLGILQNRANEDIGWKSVIPQAVQKKIRRVLGVDEGDRLINYANARYKAMQKRNIIRGGSTTATNQSLRDSANTAVRVLKEPTSTLGILAEKLPFNNARNRGIANIMTNPNVEVAERAFTEVANPQGWEAVYQALTNPKSSQAKYNAALAAYLSNGMLNY